MTSQITERPAGLLALVLWPLYRWVQRRLSEPEPPPRDPGQPEPWQARVIVAGLFTLRMTIKGLAWLGELYSRAWLYAWERRHAR